MSLQIVRITDYAWTYILSGRSYFLKLLLLPSIPSPEHLWMFGREERLTFRHHLQLTVVRELFRKT